MYDAIKLLTHQFEGQKVAFTTCMPATSLSHSVGMCTYQPVWRGRILAGENIGWWWRSAKLFTWRTARRPLGRSAWDPLRGEGRSSPEDVRVNTCRRSCLLLFHSFIMLLSSFLVYTIVILNTRRRVSMETHAQKYATPVYLRVCMHAHIYTGMHTRLPLSLL